MIEALVALFEVFAGLFARFLGFVPERFKFFALLSGEGFAFFLLLLARAFNLNLVLVLTCFELVFRGAIFEINRPIIGAFDLSEFLLAVLSGLVDRISVMARQIRKIAIALPASATLVRGGLLLHFSNSSVALLSLGLELGLLTGLLSGALLDVLVFNLVDLLARLLLEGAYVPGGFGNTTLGLALHGAGLIRGLFIVVGRARSRNRH